MSWPSSLVRRLALAGPPCFVLFGLLADGKLPPTPWAMRAEAARLEASAAAREADAVREDAEAVRKDAEAARLGRWAGSEARRDARRLRDEADNSRRYARSCRRDAARKRASARRAAGVWFGGAVLAVLVAGPAATAVVPLPLQGRVLGPVLGPPLERALDAAAAGWQRAASAFGF